jgi:hypothetical protein
MSNRDNFTEEIKTILAKRVGMRCSNPDCARPTSGPRSESTKAINIGVAAHITAASPGGKRYDANLSHLERGSAENGIWLCQNCAKLIDNDALRYTVEVLLYWKKNAEARALQEIEVPTSKAEKSRLLEKLLHFIDNIDLTTNKEKHTNLSYSVRIGLEDQHDEIEPNILYSKQTATGFTVHYMVRNKKLLTEIIFPDGKTLIADIGLNDITIHRYPHPLQEMEIEVDDKDILSKSKVKLPDGRNRITKFGKWGMILDIILDKQGRLNAYSFKNASVNIPAPFKKIIVKPKIK